MDDLSPELRAFLARSRARTQATEADQDRIRRKLSVSLAAFDGVHGLSGTPLPDLSPSSTPSTPPAASNAPPLGMPAPATAPAVGAAAVGGATVAWMAVGALLLAATGYIALERRERVVEAPVNVPPVPPSDTTGQSLAQPPPASAIAPVAVQGSPELSRGALQAPVVSVLPGVERAQPLEAPVPRPVRRRRKVRKSLAQPAEGRSLNQQAVMLQSAARALHGGDPRAAAAMLRTHAQHFPLSVLSPERDVLEVRTLCALGEEEMARARAAAFLARHPNSPLAPSMQRVCEP